jgi:hypothetical protein
VADHGGGVEGRAVRQIHRLAFRDRRAHIVEESSYASPACSVEIATLEPTQPVPMIPTRVMSGTEAVYAVLDRCCVIQHARRGPE